MEHRRSSKDQSHRFSSKYLGVILCRDRRLNEHAVKEATTERFKEEERAQDRTAKQKFQQLETNTSHHLGLSLCLNPRNEEAKRNKGAGVTHSTYFPETVDAVDAGPVQMSEWEMCKSHVQASLLHHLLFGPTLSADQRRAGAGRRGRA